MLLIIHHLVIDAVSWRILLEDFSDMYRALCDGKELQPRSKTTSYKEWGNVLYRYADSYSSRKEFDYCNRKMNRPYVSLKKKTGQYREQGHQEFYECSYTKVTLEKRKLSQNAFGTNQMELLMAAFLKTLGEIFEKGEYCIGLEGHGREQLEADLDTTRTVGWFTVQFPMDFQIKASDEWDDLLIGVKEKLRGVLKNGIGYGILKYILSQDESSYALDLKPEIIFNYLGEFDTANNEKNGIKVLDYDYGQGVSEKQNMSHVLELNLLDADGELHLSIVYDSHDIERESMMKLVDEFEKNIEDLAEYCCAKTEPVLTPADFHNKSITRGELKRVLEKHFGNVEKIMDMTPMQYGMLFDYRLNEDSQTYFEQVILHLKGTVDEKRLRASIQYMIQKNEALRTCFEYKVFEKPQQVVLKEFEMDFSVIDLEDSAEEEKALQQIYEQDRNHNFNLCDQVPMRMKLIRIRADEYRLVWSFHHILMDGWCIDLLVKDIADSYLHLLEGKECPEPVSINCQEYQNWLAEQDKTAMLDYWKNYLKGFSEIVDTRKDKGISNQIIDRKERNFMVSESCKKRLDDVCREADVTLANLMQAAWAMILGKYFDQKDIVFGIIVSGRNVDVKNIDSMVALFINTLPLRVQIAKNSTILDIASAIKEDVERHNKNSAVTLSEIQSVAEISGELFDNIFSFENYANYDRFRERLMDEKLGFKVDGVEEFEQTSFNLTIVVEPLNNEIRIKIIYNANTCNESFVDEVEFFCEQAAGAGSGE